MFFKVLVLLGLACLTSKGATLGCIRSFLGLLGSCVVYTTALKNTMFCKWCHRAAPLPAHRPCLSARSILALCTGVGTVPVPQLGVLGGSPCVTCHLWSTVPHAQGLQRAPGRWRGDKSFSLLGMRMEWLGPGALSWAALGWGRGGDWAEQGAEKLLPQTSGSKLPCAPAPHRDVTCSPIPWELSGH